MTFFSNLAQNSLGNGFFSVPELHSHIVPEPETYATAALLLIGLGISAYRSRQATLDVGSCASAGDSHPPEARSRGEKEKVI